MEIAFRITLVITAGVTLARLTLWSSAPRTRVFTTALGLLVIAGIFVEPQWRDGVDAFFATPGFSGMAADALLFAAVCLLCAYVAQIWELSRVYRAFLVTAIVGAVALAVIYALAERAGWRHGYIGDLSGPAMVYGLVVSLCTTGMSFALFVTVALARPVMRIHFWLAVLALAQLVNSLTRAAATVAPDRFADLFWRLHLPMDILSLLTISAVGLANLLRKRRVGAVAPD